MSNLKQMTSYCYGIEKYLRSLDIKVTTKNVADITCDFLKSKGLQYNKFNSRYKGLYNAAILNSELVQEHFSDFKVFVENKYLINNK